MEREVAKLPEIPFLNEIIIKALNELCFRHDNDLSSVHSDTVFVFGTAVSLDKSAETIIETVKQVSPKKLIISGGIPSYQDSYDISKPESELLYDLVHQSIPRDLKVCLEKTSNNCLENVRNSLPFLKDSEQITFVSKSFGAGRDYLTLKKFLPHSRYTQKTFDALYPGNAGYITKENWHHDVDSTKRVWGEFLRIVKYSQRGDIEHNEVKPLLDEILSNIPPHK